MHTIAAHANTNRYYPICHISQRSQIRVNLLVRWCTHFALQEQTPDHSTLAHFETRLQSQTLARPDART